jgi:uncharacterized membrane protein YcaP (DUF421 family)
MSNKHPIHAFLAIFTIGLNHVLVARLKEKSVTFRKLADGAPIITVDEIKTAIVERNGGIRISKRAEPEKRKYPQQHIEMKAA